MFCNSIFSNQKSDWEWLWQILSKQPRCSGVWWSNEVMYHTNESLPLFVGFTEIIWNYIKLPLNPECLTHSLCPVWLTGFPEAAEKRGAAHPYDVLRPMWVTPVCDIPQLDTSYDANCVQSYKMRQVLAKQIL